MKLTSKIGHALVVLACLALPAYADKWHFEDVERIVAVGDVHGAYDAFVTTLQNAGVIDDEMRWSGGQTHLVSTGDLVDRGAESRRVMDLMMRLEREASRAGGKVHQLLGNHEVMNLNGDLRYVADEEYAAFLDMESPEERESWYQFFREQRPADSDEQKLRWQFDEKNPPGYFGHRRAFRSDGRYGKWLLSKPFMIVINDTAFAHGGFPPFVAEHGLAGVNGRLKDDIVGFVETSQALQALGLLSPADRFREAPVVLTKRAEAGELQGKAVDIAVRMLDFGDSPLHGGAGPTWYRGTVECTALVEGDGLQAALDRIGASRVVVGHTPTASRQVQRHMGGRVLEVDTGMLSHVYGGSGNALVIEQGQISIVSEGGATDLAPEPHSRRIGHEAIALAESDLEQILATGELLRVAAVGARWKLVHIEGNGQTVLAVFRELPGDDDFLPELAAYKLDRMLGLGMVPVTVRRRVEERAGTLQLVPAETLTERERVATGRGMNPPCPMPKQVRAMLVFDALVHNESRTPSSMLFEPDDWELMLVDHTNAFGIEQTLPTGIINTDLVIGDEWRKALRSIDNDVLQQALGEYLDDGRMSALYKRRDLLIEFGVQ
jgi:3',5'-cyclic AMP phosphodiesterase CpdA